jgi:hypothetical protein
MLDESVLVFTAKSVETLLSEGGTASWRLNRNHARKCVYAVCTRNAHAHWVQGQEAHHSAFLVGKIREVVPSPTDKKDWLIRFSEYALVSIPDVWNGDRNPVRYIANENLKQIGIDPAVLSWKQMPAVKERPDPNSKIARSSVGTLTMTEAKTRLAFTFGVPPEAIEITIRG